MNGGLGVLGRRLGRLLLWVTLLGSAASWGWDGAPALERHVAPMRSIALPPALEGGAWARQQGLSDWQLQPGADGAQFLHFRAEAARWQQLQRLCDGSNPLAPQCLESSCQTVQNVAAPLADGAPTWLIPTPPDLNSLLAGRPDSCPRERQAAPWSGSLPAGLDPACWTVRQLSPCQSEQTPVEYLQPHWRPDQLVLLLPDDGRDIQAWALALGLQLLEVIPLPSLGQQLVRLLRPSDNPLSLDGWVERLGAVLGIGGVQKDVAYFTLADPRGAVGAAAAADVAVASTANSSPDSAVDSTPAADPLEGFNYGPALSHAHRLTARYDGRDIAVAVIDTGVDGTHPELQQRLVEQRDFTGRGYSADAHGTGVAAIIAAARGNGIGASGLAPAVRLHSFKACQPRNQGGLAAQCWSSSLIQALDAAIGQNIPLINMSLGGPPSPLLQRLVEAAAARGLLVVAAAGNGGPNASPLYPAAWPQALAVTAVDPDRQLYPLANRGAYVAIAAPGVDLITAAPGAGQPLLSGTSMASAHLTGVAALLLQLAPDTPPLALAALLQRYSEDLGTPGRDTEFGAGLLNACASAEALSGRSDLCGGTP